MEKSAIYHQPCSSYAYPYDRETMHLKVRTKKDDVQSVTLIYGDPYENVKIEERYQWINKQVNMKKVAQTDLHDYWFISVKPPYRRLQYAFVLIDSSGTSIFYGDRGLLANNQDTYSVPDNFFKFPYIHEVDLFQTPEWVKSTVWYQIFPERFDNGDPERSPSHVLPWGSKDPDRDDFFGGDLQGIINRLDYLEDLGISGIYLNPIFKSPTNHKYDTLDYYTIDPHFGDKELFRTLVQEAHKRGIRIMLDAVFNHIGSKSKQWQDVIDNEDQSIYKDWFHIHSFPVRDGENGNIDGLSTLSYDAFGFTTTMPKLNTANPEVQKYLLDIATYWIREFDIDGWRLDVANEVDHAFWKKFHHAVLKEKADLYIVGEIWHNAWNWLQGDEFHSVMNYPLTKSIINFFLEDKIDGKQLIGNLNEHFMKYSQNVNEAAFNLLDSHDTARILTLADGDKQKVKQALAFLFSQSGSPCIYYGTEVGLDGANDPLCRKCMIWDEGKQDRDMLLFTKHLIRLRKDYQEILSKGEMHWIDLDRPSLVAFRRELKQQTLTFVFNHGDHEAVVQLGEVGSCTDIWRDEIYEARTVTVPAQAFSVLLQENPK
ncbi:glycoside hydrolase family 13 protein [Sporolactobacillus terrae]|uniref:Alpha-amylase n=1 Tax=Sporolactobacillus terrae TaxID=269673 RepID=A0ABX5Q911_9BACL|nr:glycoside hydrolase family 13 protein [Sporolactobacillus terrae]QAA23158.1 alpha-glycosidase [Sporolactobacillus terrae]QAA26128.1 alpha-glycosidase [Sporolactobacillus terrae]UAK15224.1 alpha-glycosidase [Sporolactobacillus terrae]